MFKFDLLVKNARIFPKGTNTSNPLSWMIVHKQRIYQIGSGDIPQADYNNIIDIQNAIIIPGFIDAHAHLHGFAKRLLSVQLDNAKSKHEALQILKKIYEKEPKIKGQWLVATGWDDSTWQNDGYLTAEDLDTVSNQIPIVAIRVCGHLYSFNHKGLEKVILPKDFGAGYFRHDPITKENTGVSVDIEIDRSQFWDKNVMVNALKNASYELNKLGITAVYDFIDTDAFKDYFDTLKQDKLSTRVWLSPRIENLETLASLGMFTGYGSEYLRTGGIKFYLDGSLGAFSAWISFPYQSNDDKKFGIQTLEHEKFKEDLKRVKEVGLTVSAHAIGDNACQQLLDTYKELMFDKKQVQKSRDRIEHGEIIREEQLDLIAEIGLAICMQPNFVARWGHKNQLYEQRIGEHYLEMNQFRTVIDKRIDLYFGSDGMPYSPLFGIQGAVTHPNSKYRLTVEEATEIYTYKNSYALFAENEIGSLENGKYADFVILSSAPWEVKDTEISKITIIATYLGGKQVYFFSNSDGKLSSK